MESQLPDWEILTLVLYQEVVKTIDTFAREFPNEECSFLGFAVPLSEPYLGIITVNFDTPDNSSGIAQKIEAKILDRRKSLFYGSSKIRLWGSGTRYLDRKSVLPYNSDMFSFKYYNYGQVNLPQLENIDETILPLRDIGDDYISGNIRILLWDVFNRIVENSVLKKLKLASPFYLGYQLSDENNETHDMVIIQILNWPFSIEASS